MNIATTDYSFDAQIVKLSIVDIHNNILFDSSFSSSRPISIFWKNKIEKSDIDFLSKIDEIISILKDKIVICYGAGFIKSTLKSHVNIRDRERYLFLCRIKTICLMQVSAYIFQESFYHYIDSNFNYIRTSIRYQRLARVVNFYKLENYKKDFLYFDYVCNESALDDTFILTHIFSKILSYTKDNHGQLYAKNLLIDDLKIGVI